MNNLRQRLRKRETGMIGAIGHVPDSEPWFTYWEDIIDRFIAGEEPIFRGRIPLEVVDRLIEQADRADGLLP
jgi:hypothetical protein